MRRGWSRKDPFPLNILIFSPSPSYKLIELLKSTSK